jgi:hypothetical protein
LCLENQFSEKTAEQWADALRPLADSVQLAGIGPLDSCQEWVKIAFRPWAVRFLRSKQAEARRLNWMARNLGYTEGGIASPGPLTAGLASGMLGAGLGYGTGWVAEKLLPDHWKKKRLSRVMALLGGAAGVSLPALWAATNVHNGRHRNDLAAAHNAVPGGASLRNTPEELRVIKSRPGWENLPGVDAGGGFGSGDGRFAFAGRVAAGHSHGCGEDIGGDGFRLFVRRDCGQGAGHADGHARIDAGQIEANGGNKYCRKGMRWLEISQMTDDRRRNVLQKGG